jgi:hypothetical protein
MLSQSLELPVRYGEGLKNPCKSMESVAFFEPQFLPHACVAAAHLAEAICL